MAERHENLIAWQRADSLCVDIYRLTRRRFPAEERFGLTSQLRRASYSVAANIVEGFAFKSAATRLRFLRIAVASLAEVGYAIHLAKRLDYLPGQEADEIKRAVRQTAAPLHGLIKEVEREVATQPAQ